MKSEELTEAGITGVDVITLTNMFIEGYMKLTDEEKEAIVKEYDQSKAATQEKLSPPSTKSKARITTHTLKCIISCIEALARQCGIEAFFCLVCNSTDDFMDPQWYFSNERIEAFLKSILKGFNCLEVGKQLEAFARVGCNPATMPKKKDNRDKEYKRIWREAMYNSLCKATGKSKPTAHYKNFEKHYTFSKGIMLEGMRYRNVGGPEQLIFGRWEQTSGRNGRFGISPGILPRCDAGLPKKRVNKGGEVSNKEVSDDEGKEDEEEAGGDKDDDTGTPPSPIIPAPKPKSKKSKATQQKKDAVTPTTSNVPPSLPSDSIPAPAHAPTTKTKSKPKATTGSLPDAARPKAKKKMKPSDTTATPSNANQSVQPHAPPAKVKPGRRKKQLAPPDDSVDQTLEPAAKKRKVTNETELADPMPSASGPEGYGDGVETASKKGKRKIKSTKYISEERDRAADVSPDGGDTTAALTSQPVVNQMGQIKGSGSGAGQFVANHILTGQFNSDQFNGGVYGNGQASGAGFNADHFNTGHFNAGQFNTGQQFGSNQFDPSQFNANQFNSNQFNPDQFNSGGQLNGGGHFNNSGGHFNNGGSHSNNGAGQFNGGNFNSNLFNIRGGFSNLGMSNKGPTVQDPFILPTPPSLPPQLPPAFMPTSQTEPIEHLLMSPIVFEIAFDYLSSKKPGELDSMADVEKAWKQALGADYSGTTLKPLADILWSSDVDGELQVESGTTRINSLRAEYTTVAVASPVSVSPSSLTTNPASKRASPSLPPRSLSPQDIPQQDTISEAEAIRRKAQALGSRKIDGLNAQVILSRRTRPRAT
ncbi:hypothetical protein PM082_014193 [Marasmius tenuissimus]|nr:hypothetical protein PM082_014193 [Marasmius tenuissimus]